MPRTQIPMQRYPLKDYYKCLSFNGTSNGIVTSSVWSTATTNVSMGVWFQSTNYTQNRQPLISNGTSFSTNHGYALELSGNGTTDGSIMILSHNLGWFDCRFKVQDNNNHFIMMTIDGSNNITVYLDGVSRYTGNQGLSTPSGNSVVGADGVGFFKGSLDEPRFYTRKLSAAEATNLYYNVETFDVPINFYKFNEGSGTTAIDSGTNPLNMTAGGNVYPTYITSPFSVLRTVATGRTLAS